MEEDDLYGDLELAAKSADLERAQLKLKESETENSRLVAEVEQLRAQLILLVDEKEVLEKNCVTIYNTAMREINRKDNEIKDLRSQLVRFKISSNEQS